MTTRGRESITPQSRSRSATLAVTSAEIASAEAAAPAGSTPAQIAEAIRSAKLGGTSVTEAARAIGVSAAEAYAQKYSWVWGRGEAGRLAALAAFRGLTPKKIEQVATTLAKETGVPIQAARETVTAHPEEYGVLPTAPPAVPAPEPPAVPDKVVSIGTITKDTPTGEELGLKTGDHFLTVRRDGERVNIAISEANWQAYDTGKIDSTQLAARTRVEVAGVPSTEWETKYIEAAKAEGETTDRDIEDWVRRRWYEQHNITAEDLALAGAGIPGVTITEPLPGTAVEPPKPGDTHIKVYGEKSTILTILLDKFTSVAQARGKEQFEGMVELGIIKSGAEFVKGEGDEWSYYPAWSVREREWAKDFEKRQVALMPKYFQDLYRSKGYNAMLDTFNKDIAVLEPYLTPDGNYEIVKALISDDRKVIDAANSVFDAKDVKSAKDFIRDNYTGEFWKDKGVILSSLNATYRYLTPWVEEKGETAGAWGMEAGAWVLKDDKDREKRLLAPIFNPVADFLDQCAEKAQEWIGIVQETDPLTGTDIARLVAAKVRRERRTIVTRSGHTIEVVPYHRLTPTQAGIVSFEHEAYKGVATLPLVFANLIFTGTGSLAKLEAGRPKADVFLPVAAVAFGMGTFMASRPRQIIINPYATSGQLLGLSWGRVPGAGTLARVAKTSGIKSVKITVGTGAAAKEVVVWRGVTALNRPIVGVKSFNKLTGQPIKSGWYPVTKLETYVLATQKAMKELGFKTSEINKVTQTLAATKLFRGKPSPYLDPQTLIQGTGRITAQEMQVILREVARRGKDIQQVYGSSTIAPQIAKALRKWRETHDVDIQTNLGIKATEAFVVTVVARLKAIGSPVRINPKNPLLIDKLIKGKWEKIGDIHSNVPVPYEVISPGAYGLKFAEPSIVLKFKDIGTISIMRLSETGVRKMQGILEWQPGRRINPMSWRTNDIVDFYIILRTFKGEKIANEWAKVFNKTPEQLLKLAEKNPPSVAGWTFKPDANYKSGPITPSNLPNTIPSVSIVIPSALKAILASKSASLARSIAVASSPFLGVSPDLKSSVSPLSPSASAKFSNALSVSAFIRPSQSISTVVSTSPSLSRSLSSSVSPSSSSAYPSLYASPSPSPSPPPSYPPSPPPSYPPSPPPSYPPSPPPSYPPEPPPKVPPKEPPAYIPRSLTTVKGKVIDFTDAVVWYQGKLGRGAKQKDLWYYIPRPYKKVLHYLGDLPAGVTPVKGGAEAAYRSIQAITGKDTPVNLKVDMGIMDITISSPGVIPGKEGAIKYERDIKQETTGDVQIGQSMPIRGFTTDEALRKLPLSTTLEQLLRWQPTDKDIRKGKVKAKEKFVKARLMEKVAKADKRELARTIQRMKLPKSKIDEIKAMLPDRERKVLEFYLEQTVEYAPIRGLPKPVRPQKKLMRKKPKKNFVAKLGEETIGTVRW